MDNQTEAMDSQPLRIKNVLRAFDLLATNCEHKQTHDADCHHPDRDFDCVCCAPCNCPLLLED